MMDKRHNEMRATSQKHNNAKQCTIEWKFLTADTENIVTFVRNCRLEFGVDVLLCRIKPQFFVDTGWW